MVDKFSMTHYN